MEQPANTLALLEKIATEQLYIKLIHQLNKDFQLANLEEEIKIRLSAIQLKEALEAILLRLFTKEYDAYLNFLYRVDVAESELLKVKTNELPAMITEVAFIVLKRVFQKVWLKQHFDTDSKTNN